MRRNAVVTHLRRSVVVFGAMAAVLAAAVVGAPAANAAPPWTTGDVFVAISNGSYQVHDNNGNLKETISDGLGGFTTGCAFNPTLTKLYTTNFTFNKVEVYDNTSHSLIQTINTSSSLNESIVFDSVGSFYVSHPGGGIDHFDASGALLATLAVGVRTDWMDLAADQSTMFYTDEGSTIHRWNVVANTPLPDFASVPSGQGFALRLLPPGDGSGGLLLAQFASVLRYAANGSIAQTYDAAGENRWFGLTLDPNGTSFWSAGADTANFYRINIATGSVELGPINTGTGNQTLLGMCVKGEPTAAASADLSITKTDSPDPVTVGGVLTYQLAVSNAGPAAATGVSVTDPLPAGTTFISASPSQGSCALASGTLTCALGTVANGGSATITIKVKPTVKTTLSNTARVTANETDPNPANNTATATTRALLVRGSAFGEQVRSPLVNSGPLPTVSRTTPGTATNSLASINVPGILSASTLAVRTQVGNDATVSSEATIAHADLLGGVVSADTIRSTCAATASGVSGTTTIASLTVAGLTQINLTPAPNTGINIVGVGVLVLNEQTVPEPGGLTVNALHLHTIAGIDIILAQATCIVDP